MSENEVSTKSKSKKKSKKAPKHSNGIKIPTPLIFVIVASVLIIVTYCVVGIYFSGHFLPGTTINNSDVSQMTIDEARETLIRNADSYRLTLVEQDFKNEVINGDDVGLRAEVSSSFDDMLNAKYGFAWIANIFKKNDYILENGMITYYYDEIMLSEIIDELECIDPQYPIEVKNAEIVLLDGDFAIVPESVGNIAHRAELEEQIKEAIIEQEETINLEECGLYDVPNVRADDPDLKAQLQLYKELDDFNVILKFGQKNVLIDVKNIAGWIKAERQYNGSYTLGIRQDKLEEYVSNLANTYDTYDKTKFFQSHAGNVVEITTGDYGWKLDQEVVAEKLKELVMNRQNVTIDLTDGSESSDEWWERKAVSYDTEGSGYYGSTYAEVSIAEQHMWMYQNGKIVLETDVVTGNPNLGNDTPQGAFRIRYHETNAVLTGPGYQTPVAYWMVFADDVGFHDATWQPAFGGSLYYTNGSHGCVNMPLDKAAELFDLVYDDMPVFVY